MDLATESATESAHRTRDDRAHNIARVSDKVIIYTDGACRGNPGPGGWGALLRFGAHEKSLHGSARETTNNRMELTAAIEALNALRRDCRVELYTDSQYLQNGVQQWMEKWKRKDWRTADRKPVKNRDLWETLDHLRGRHQIAWHWVKGHAGDVGNERADRLANDAIDRMLSSGEAPSGEAI
ncbi:MAG: ribonuclease HI [bacterium]